MQGAVRTVDLSVRKIAATHLGRSAESEPRRRAWNLCQQVMSSLVSAGLQSQRGGKSHTGDRIGAVIERVLVSTVQLANMTGCGCSARGRSQRLTSGRTGSHQEEEEAGGKRDFDVLGPGRDDSQDGGGNERGDLLTIRMLAK